jgi:hypothetical protein
MSWDADRWDAFCGLVEEAWPGEFDDVARKSWRVLLDEIDPQAAIGGMRRLLFAGGTFRPSVSELLAAVRLDPSAPTFDEAYQLLFGPRGAMLGYDVEEVSQRLDTIHPLIGTFVRRQGYRRLKELPLDDPNWGEQRRRELREAWDRHVEATDAREVAALALGEGHEGLRKLDPLASLPGPRRELPSGKEA